MAALLAACASMSKDECLQADWYAVGLEDGARGLPVETAGLPTPAARAREVERLEGLYREADQLDARIRDAESR